jgi:hypothetical protein
MIPMGMGENEVILVYPLRKELIAQPSYTGAGVDNNDVVALCSDFKTGGIATVFQVIFSGNRC